MGWLDENFHLPISDELPLLCEVALPEVVEDFWEQFWKLYQQQREPPS